MIAIAELHNCYKTTYLNRYLKINISFGSTYLYVATCRHIQSAVCISYAQYLTICQSWKTLTISNINSGLHVSRGQLSFPADYNARVTLDFIVQFPVTQACNSWETNATTSQCRAYNKIHSCYYSVVCSIVLPGNNFW